MQILTVDDDDFTLDVLEHTLAQMGHETIRAHDGQEALGILRQGDVRLAITDWDMPGMNGVELCQAIRADEINGYVYLIMLTGREGAKSRREGLYAGADDFLNKPLDPDELLVCLKTAERILALETRDVALFALAKLAESRDPETGEHVERVQSYARLLAQNLSPEARRVHGVDGEYVRLLHQTSPLHDLGKVAIPDAVLLKPGKLSPSEFEVMKTHTLAGADTLNAALQRFPNARFLQMARDIAISHHEKFDGSGYPNGLAGEQIPFCGRIVALADVYDALTSRRVYKDAMPHENARHLILAERGRHFDPEVVDAFLAAETKIQSVRDQLGDAPSEIIKPAAAFTPQDFSTDPAGNTILVVEDHAVVLNKLVELLKTTGQTVLSATNAQEAMKLFTEHRPGLVLSDWEMPGASGLELCRQIRQESAGQPVHFIMLTINSGHESLMEAYKAGVNDFVSKPFNPEELVARVRAGLRTCQLHRELALKTAGLQSLNAQLSTMNSRLDRLSITDELSGLFNRRHAMVRLEEQWALSERYGRPLTIAMLDIDHFKPINDTYGHAAGDLILKEVAEILRASTRGTDVLCRVGGEEFLILFPSQTLSEAEVCAERCRSAMEKHLFMALDAKIQATISIGIACRSEKTKEFTDLMREADEALYSAKHGGRNRVCTAADKIQEVPMQAENSLLNTDVIVQRCGGDATFAAAVVQRFAAQAPVEMRQIETALAAKNADDLRRSAHSLKSMAAYVSADTASEFSRKIEALAKQAPLAFEETEAAVRQLRDEIDRVNAWIAEQTAAGKLMSAS